MPSKIHVQTDFSGGVVDSRIEGRTEAARYDKTMRQADNFVVTRSGTLRKRPGTVYVGDAFARGGVDPKNNTSVDQEFRLVPWDTSDGRRTLLSISKTMVSCYENENPGVGQLGRGMTTTFSRPAKPTAERPQDNRISYSLGLNDVDEELESEQTVFNSTKFKEPNMRFLRTCPVGDTCYIANEGYQLHCCVKESFYGPNGNPFVRDFLTNGLYNLPVSFIDGPYATSFTGNEDDNSRKYGPVFSSLIPDPLLADYENQHLSHEPYPGVGDVRELPERPPENPNTFEGDDKFFRRFGRLTFMRLSLSKDITEQGRFANLEGELEEGLAQFYNLDTEVTRQQLADAINQNISAEHTCCYEFVDDQGKIKRLLFNVYGAFVANVPAGTIGGQAWADRWVSNVTDTYDIIDGTNHEKPGVLVLACRITNTEGHPSVRDPDNPMGSTGSALNPYFIGSNSGRAHRLAGTLRWGIRTDKGVRAIHETQDRLGVVFEDDPGRVYYTRTSGFGIFSHKNNIPTAFHGNIQGEVRQHNGALFRSSQHMRSRVYLDFGSGLVSDTLAVSSSDGFDVLPDGLNGSRINHLKTMFDGVIIFTERGCALLRGGTSRQLDALSFVSRKVNDEGAMRSCEPQDIESGIIYVDSTGSKLIYLQSASNADTALASTDVSYTSRDLLTPEAVTIGGRDTPPMSTSHKSLSLVSTPVNQTRICKSDGSVVNFSIDAAGQFFAFTRFTQNITSQYTGEFLNYAQVVSKLGGYVFVANRAQRSVINGLTDVAEILRETIDPDQGAPESLVCLDRMGILVETAETVPDPDDPDGDGNDTEASRIGVMVTIDDGSPPTTNTIRLVAENSTNFFNVGDKFKVTPQVDQNPQFETIQYIDPETNNQETPPWSTVVFTCTSVAQAGGQQTRAECTLTDVNGDNFEVLLDAGFPAQVFTGFDLEVDVLIEKIQDSGGLFLDGKSFTAFPHLANETIVVHKNGVETTTTLDSTGGTSLSITDFYENFIGLPFSAKYESMPLQRLPRLSSSDDSRITLKRIYRAFLKVVRSVGGNINGKVIDYTLGEAAKNLNRYDGIVEHNIDSTHKIDETLNITHSDGNMLEIASITYEIDSGGVS